MTKAHPHLHTSTPTASVVLDASRGLLHGSHGRGRSRRGVSLTLALLATIALVGVGALVMSASSFLSAKHARITTAETLVLRRAQFEELASLRRATATLPRSSGDLTSRMTAVLASCGLPSSTLGSVLPEPPVELPGPSGVARTRQVVRVSLEKLTLPTLGRVLDTWRAAEPAWAITAIDLAAVQAAKPLAPGEDRQLRLRATLTLDAVFSDTSVDVQSGARQDSSKHANFFGGGT